MILHSKPWITESDIAFVTDVIRSGMIAQGEVTELLEQKFAEHVGGSGAIAVGSGSGSMLLALHALNLKNSDEVILPTYVCPSVLDAVISAGCVPVLCDVGENWVITDKSVKKVLSPRSKAIIAPHMYGIFADIASLKSLGLVVIEDSAQALADREQWPVAGDISVFSLHPTKCLTAGEGGIAVSSNHVLLGRMKELRDKRSQPHFRIFSPMSDICAALALSQLKRYAEFLKIRRAIAAEYIDLLGEIAPSCLPAQTFSRSMFYRFPIIISENFEDLRLRFEKLGVHVRKGVDVLLHRLLLQPDTDFSVATRLFSSTLSLPIYPALTKEELHICKSAATNILAS